MNIELTESVMDAAINSGNPLVVRYIMGPKNREFYKRYSKTPVIKNAAKRKDLELVKALVETGLPINFIDYDIAGIPGTLKILKYLIRRGKRGNPIDTYYHYGSVPFVHAVKSPENLSYIVDKYLEDIPEHLWVDALQAATRPDFITHEDYPPIESLFVLLENHKYSEDDLHHALKLLEERKKSAKMQEYVEVLKTYMKEK